MFVFCELRKHVCSPSNYKVNNPFGVSRREHCKGFNFIFNQLRVCEKLKHIQCDVWPEVSFRKVLELIHLVCRGRTSKGIYTVSVCVCVCQLNAWSVVYHLGRVTVSGGDCPLRCSHASCNRSWGIWNHVMIISSPLPRPGNSSAAPVITLLHYCYCITVALSLCMRFTLGHSHIPLIKHTTVMEIWTSVVLHTGMSVLKSFKSWRVTVTLTRSTVTTVLLEILQETVWYFEKYASTLKCSM